jgi:DNA repair protein RadA/Sms
MAKTKTHFLCRNCGGVQSRWMGKCPDCGAWDGLEKFVEPKVAVASAHEGLVETWAAGAGDEPEGPASVTIAVPLGDVERAQVDRMASGLGELDRVLGGGFVPGSVVMLGGEPGIGKSTLLLQAAARVAARGDRVLYVSSEESAYQTRLRAERLGATGSTPPVAELSELLVLAETNLARIVEQARTVQPRLLVLDSIQMAYLPTVEASPGSVGQLRRCCTELVYLAKRTGMAVALVGHVTKEGQLAGPKLLEHLVDAVLSFDGDRHHAHRVVRAVKNRFGTTLEVGLFEMTGHGLAEVTEEGMLPDPDAEPAPGAALCPVMHGSRCLMVEVQALTAPGFPGSAKRRTSGLDPSRLAMLIAVLEQHGGLRLSDQDVFASAVGGLKIVEPAADLAVCLAIAGAHTRRSLPVGTAVVGEVGLGGEVRAVPRLEQRMRAASRLGCSSLVTGRGAGGPGAGSSARLEPVRSVAEALERLGPPVAARGSGGGGAG